MSTDLSINFKYQKKKSKLILKSILKNNFFYLKLSYSKFVRDLQNTQTQTSNSQKVENSNPNLSPWVFFWVHMPGFSTISRFHWIKTRRSCIFEKLYLLNVSIFADIIFNSEKITDPKRQILRVFIHILFVIFF